MVINMANKNTGGQEVVVAVAVTVLFRMVRMS